MTIMTHQTSPLLSHPLAYADNGKGDVMIVVSGGLPRLPDPVPARWFIQNGGPDAGKHGLAISSGPLRLVIGPIDSAERATLEGVARTGEVGLASEDLSVSTGLRFIP